MTAAQAADRTEVRARVEAYRTVWNTHDAEALARFFTEDADLVMGNRPARHGRREIRGWWRDYFDGLEPGRHLTLDVSPVRFLGADVAAVNVATTTGGTDPSGRALAPRRFRGAWLWQRRGGDWRITAMRGFPTEEDRVVLNGTVAAAAALRPQIRALVAAYEDAWNSRDPAAVSAFFTGDAQIVVRNLPVVHGREGIETSWRRYFAEPRPYRALFIIDDIRTLAPGVALINLTVTGAASAPDDERAPLRYTRASWVTVRDAGGWRICAIWVLPSEDDRIIRASDRPG